MARATANNSEVATYTEPETQQEDEKPSAYDQFGQVVYDELDLAVVEVNRGDFDLDSVPSVEERQKEARVAVQKSTSDLIGHPCVFARWRPQSALLTNTGEVTEGYFCVGVDLFTKETFSVFIGGIALCRTLRNVKAPMRATIELRGRTLIFK